MLSNKEIVCPNNLLDLAHKKKGVKVAVVNAGKPLPMLSVQDAVNENLIEPIFIGHEVEIQKCAEDIKWDISKYELVHEPVESVVLNSSNWYWMRALFKGQHKVIQYHLGGEREGRGCGAAGGGAGA